MYIVVTNARTRMPGGHVVIVAGTVKEGNSTGESFNDVVWCEIVSC